MWKTLGLVALDDLDAVLGVEAWELALFDLYNRSKEWGLPLANRRQRRTTST